MDNWREILGRLVFLHSPFSAMLPTTGWTQSVARVFTSTTFKLCFTDVQVEFLVAHTTTTGGFPLNENICSALYSAFKLEYSGLYLLSSSFCSSTASILTEEPCAISPESNSYLKIPLLVSSYKYDDFREILPCFETTLTAFPDLAFESHLYNSLRRLISLYRLQVDN